MTMEEIGCCGAYCRTCKELRDGHCKGCKLGYDTGERDITRAKCKIKVCCFKEKKLMSCAECDGFDSCEITKDWYSKGDRIRYRRSLVFIRDNGHDKFTGIADKWKNAKGSLKT